MGSTPFGKNRSLWPFEVVGDMKELVFVRFSVRDKEGGKVGLVFTVPVWLV